MPTIHFIASISSISEYYCDHPQTTHRNTGNALSFYLFLYGRYVYDASITVSNYDRQPDANIYIDIYIFACDHQQLLKCVRPRKPSSLIPIRRKRKFNGRSTTIRCVAHKSNSLPQISTRVSTWLPPPSPFPLTSSFAENCNTIRATLYGRCVLCHLKSITHRQPPAKP